MARPPIADTPMTPAERRRKSDKAKLDRGEMRLTNWISPDAANALLKLTGGSTERGAIKAALETALIKAAARIK